MLGLPQSHLAQIHCHVCVICQLQSGSQTHLDKIPDTHNFMFFQLHFNEWLQLAQIFKISQLSSGPLLLLLLLLLPLLCWDAVLPGEFAGPLLGPLL